MSHFINTHRNSPFRSEYNGFWFPQIAWPMPSLRSTSVPCTVPPIVQAFWKAYWCNWLASQMGRTAIYQGCTLKYQSISQARQCLERKFFPPFSTLFISGIQIFPGIFWSLSFFHFLLCHYFFPCLGGWLSSVAVRLNTSLYPWFALMKDLKYSSIRDAPC